MFKIMHRIGHGILTWMKRRWFICRGDLLLEAAVSGGHRLYFTSLCLGRKQCGFMAPLPPSAAGSADSCHGQPRNDMLRPELRPFYEDEIRKIHDRYGEYLLVNTNFNHVNAFFLPKTCSSR